MKSENNIPKFDLAEQIMSGQRKFAAAKRVAPKSRVPKQKSSDTKPNITSYQPQNIEKKISEKLKPNSGWQGSSEVLNFVSDNSINQIISEIVARDIQNLRKS